MIKLSVCVETFWPDVPFEQKVRNASALGFRTVEFWNYSNKDIDAVRKVLDETGLTIACFCMEPNFCLTDAARRDAILAGISDSVRTARRLGTNRLIVTTGNEVPREERDTTRARIVGILKELAARAEDTGVTLLLEPLNTRVDHPGYFLTTMDEAASIVDEVGSKALKILMDLYHQQITEGDLIRRIGKYIDRIGHFHCAGVPGRHELLGGELDYAALFLAIDEAGFTGCVGLELFPAADSDIALRQAQRLSLDDRIRNSEDSR